MRHFMTLGMTMSVCPPFSSRLKYRTDICVSQRMNSIDCDDPLTFPLNTSRITFLFFNEMYFLVDCQKVWFIIHVPLRMNCKNFGDPLTFHRVPSSGQHFNVSSTLVYDLKMTVWCCLEFVKKLCFSHMVQR